MKLDQQSISHLNKTIAKPNYDKSRLVEGIVHIGVGGFHRAHQAVYTDALLANEPEWAICGIGLRPADKAMMTTLEGQDYYYSLIELGYEKENQVQIVGSINNFIFAPEDPEAAIQKLAATTTRIVSLTITEGGYNVDDDTRVFDLNNPDIAYDLTQPETPRTVFSFLHRALKIRRKNSIPAFTVLSCDNLPQNGDIARHALISFVAELDPSLSKWIEDEVSFPNSMVDRITPQTDSKHIDWLKEKYDLEDQWPVVCEPFSQWVMEDRFTFGRPRWEEVGATFTSNVTPYEKVKIRLLNASHMAMSFLGVLSGYQFTHEVIEDKLFFKFIENFMDLDVSPDLINIKEVDIDRYKKSLMQRFSNRKIADQLSRLCLDSSSKMPKFMIPTVLSAIRESRPLGRLALILAGWAYYLFRSNERGELDLIDDPLVEVLLEAVRERDLIAQRFLGLTKIFTNELLESADFVAAFEDAFISLEKDGVKNSIRELVSNDDQHIRSEQ